MRIKRFTFILLRKTIDLIACKSKKISSSTKTLNYPPIFIVGPPRSGTTLLYQLMAHHFHIAYFTNIANKFYTSPILITALGLKFCVPYIEDFSSNYGYTDGLMAPSEGKAIWNRWYPTHDKGYNYTPAGYFNDHIKHCIYQTAVGIEQLFKAPFVSKNINHSVRIRSLVEIFPNAMFIQMKRAPLDIAMSLLRARKQKRGNVNVWWSVMPKEIEQLKDLDHLHQICGQIFYTEKNIEEDIATVCRDRCHLTHYEKLCQDPYRELQQIAMFVQSQGGRLSKKHEIPGSFKQLQHKAKFTNDQERTLMKILSGYYML